MNVTKIAVLVSGHSGGTNFQAIIDAIDAGNVQAKIALLISTNDRHGAVARARAANIETLILPPAEYKSQEDWDHKASNALYEKGVSIVCLAGYLRMISPVLLEAFPDRILNVHPSLLPSFGGKGMYGLRVHRAVLEHGCKVTGCTVHIVNEDYDLGPIVDQACVLVNPGDTPESLSLRVQAQEHRIYPQCIDWMARDLLRVEGRKIIRQKA